MKLGVLGLGHVGLPTALVFAELGWDVSGTDSDGDKVRRIAEAEPPFHEPGLEELLRKYLNTGRFRVVSDVGEVVREADILFVCVGTPQRENGSPDLSQVEEVARTIARNLNGYKVVVEKSTVPVQTARWLTETLRRYRRADHEFDVASNPEFMREGRALEDLLHPDRVVIGVETERARDLLLEVYRPLVERGLPPERILVTDLYTAELIKHAANAFLALKISYINMIADLCEATGADVVEVAHGIGLDPRIGPDFLQAGIGFGGYCLPKDLRAFICVAREHGVDFSLLEEVERINLRCIERFIRKIREALWVLKGKTLAVWGLSFKPGTDDIREAPSLKIVSRLLKEGARLRLYDPQAMEAFKACVPPGEGVYYARDPYDAAYGACALLLLTEWGEFLRADFSRVQERMELPIIVDGRNALDREALRALGFEYYGIGRR